MNASPLGFVLASLLSMPFSTFGDDAVSSLKRDEEVLLFPAYAALSHGGEKWEGTLEGVVYEPERDGIARNALLHALVEALDLDERALYQSLFVERARPFLYDHERGKRVCVRVRGETFCGGPSKADGRLILSVRLQGREGESAKDTFVPASAVLRDSDPRRFTTRLRLTSPEGLMVVSDIDDTIKISDVGDLERLLERTFLEPFEAVPGMVEAFSSLEKAGAAFHYVSNSPWQLHVPLESFLGDAGFPRGIMHLRPFRWKDRSFRDFLRNPEGHKRSTIRDLLKDFPARRFVLVGDTTERDPKIYADLARRHPQQVVRVILRDASGGGRKTAELEAIFAGLPGTLWEVFSRPSTIDWEAAPRWQPPGGGVDGRSER